MGNGPINLGVVGVGQAGTNFGQSLVQVKGGSPEFLATINLSDLDIVQATLVPENNRLHLDPNMHGAGKNRNVSKLYSSEKMNEIISFLTKVYHKACNVILVCFSTSGGTGSGMGPFITALLESDAMADAKPNRCVVIGVPLIGDLNEGRDLLVNTVSCLKEVNTLVKNKRARFMPVHNQSKIDIKDDIEKWKTINDEASHLINRYFFIHYPSKYSNLDPEDRFVLLNTPGLHSLLTFNPADTSVIHTPFILPDGASIQRLGCELPKNYGEKRFELIKNLGANVTEPNYVGLYEDVTPLSEDGMAPPIPIAHFAGFNNLVSFIKNYQIQVDRLESVDTTGSIANETGTGFDKSEDNIKKLNKKNEMIKAKNPNEILSELL
jgi:hypothetical protein